jgi:urease accessory protein
VIVAEVSESGWAAELALRFAVRGERGRTELVGRRHVGPLRVQRPFHPEPSGACHVYVLHPPGGVVGGDQLALDVSVESGAHALLTTPAAAKLYRSAGPCARVQQALRVGEGARLEWLPHENIAFSAANAELTTRVELEQGARFLGWVVLCLGGCCWGCCGGLVVGVVVFCFLVLLGLGFLCRVLKEAMAMA